MEEIVMKRQIEEDLGLREACNNFTMGETD
jgi:hypothetical protein